MMVTQNCTSSQIYSDDDTDFLTSCQNIHLHAFIKDNL